MKIYKGKRLSDSEVKVTVDDKSLKHQVYHSPTGMEWGYLGSGPADLARSILWDYLGKEPSRNLYMDFKDRFVAGWGEDWQIDSMRIQDWMIKTVLENLMGKDKEIEEEFKKLGWDVVEMIPEIGEIIGDGKDSISEELIADVFHDLLEAGR